MGRNLMMTNEIIADNLRRLMEYKGINTQTELARKIRAKIGGKISQRTISNLLNPGSTEGINTVTTDALAEYFGIESYKIFIPGIPIEELVSNGIDKVISCYSKAKLDGRENIKRIAENEARYSQIINDGQ